jgi:hypothetical protein
MRVLAASDAATFKNRTTLCRRAASRTGRADLISVRRLPGFIDVFTDQAMPLHQELVSGRMCSHTYAIYARRYPDVDARHQLGLEPFDVAVYGGHKKMGISTAKQPIGATSSSTLDRSSMLARPLDSELEWKTRGRNISSHSGGSPCRQLAGDSVRERAWSAGAAGGAGPLSNQLSARCWWRNAAPSCCACVQPVDRISRSFQNGGIGTVTRVDRGLPAQPA